MHYPCDAYPNGLKCGWPVDQLEPGHVLVEWAISGLPNWTLSSFPGKTRTVGGQPAREAITRPGECGNIQADETITVEIPSPAAIYNWFSMTACLRSPQEMQSASQVQRMLDTVALSKS